LLFYADKVMMMGNSKNSRENLMLAKYTFYSKHCCQRSSFLFY